MKQVVSITTCLNLNDFRNPESVNATFISQDIAIGLMNIAKLKCAKLYFYSIINDSCIIQDFLVIAYRYIIISELI